MAKRNKTTRNRPITPSTVAVLRELPVNTTSQEDEAYSVMASRKQDTGSFLTNEGRLSFRYGQSLALRTLTFAQEADSNWDLTPVEETVPMRLQVLIEHEDSNFIVECPAIPGCVTQGKTKEEVLLRITEAIRGCLEVRKEMGLSLPEVVEVEV